jgi:hypothetical protein
VKRAVRILGILFLDLFFFALHVRAEVLEQIHQALAMFGGEGDRLAEAEGEGFEPASFAAAAFGLVGGDDDGRVLLAEPAGDFLVERGDALASIDNEQGDVGLADGGLGLPAHPAGEACGILVLEAGGVHDIELEAEQGGMADATIAGHTRTIIDQRHALADETVEEGRLAHVRAPDDGDDGIGHGWPVRRSSEPLRAAASLRSQQRRSYR